MENQYKLFLNYFDKYGKFHYVPDLIRIKKWCVFPDDLHEGEKNEDFCVGHREIFPDELVIDFDTTDKEVLNKSVEFVTNKLKKSNVSFVAYNSGGKFNVENLPNHFHIIFPELKNFEVETRKIYKEKLLDYFLGKYKLISKADYQMTGKHLIRAEFGRHEKTFVKKRVVFRYDTLVQISNKIPETVKRETELFISNLKKETGVHGGTFKFASLNKITSPCISIFYTPDFINRKDGRKRALKMICQANYISYGNDGINEVFKWNNEFLGGQFTEIFIQREFYSIKAMVESGKQFGCRYINQILNSVGMTTCEACKK